MPPFLRLALILWATLLLGPQSLLVADEFEVRVVDGETQKPISVRMSIRNERGALIKQRGVPYHFGSFCFFGQHTFKLPRGIYFYTIEKGLEYRTVSGQFEVKRGANDGVTVSIPRFTDMAAKGWWSGDLEVYRPQKDVPVLMDANDVHFANLIAQNNEGDRLKKGFPDQQLKKVTDRITFHQTGIVDSRYGGGIIILGSARPLSLPKPGSVVPYSALPETKKDLHFAANASIWDLPIHLARHEQDPDFQLQGINIAGDVVTQETYKKKRSDLRPFPKNIVGDHKTEQWQTKIYYHVLNCGLKIPPVASSASGNTKSPVGHNRVYVHCGKNFSYDKWIENLKLGRTVVTNGPIMNVLFNGVLPGETLQVSSGSTMEMETTMTLSLKEKAEYLEIIRNGMVAEKISLDEYAKARGRLPKLTFKESGWMLARVVTNNKQAFRFACSAPVYVQIGDQPMVKKESAQFFLDWVIERGKMIKNSSAADKDAALAEWRKAFDFWKEKVDSATR